MRKIDEVNFDAAKEETDDTFFDTQKVASSFDCTGLIPAAVADEEDAESYGSLYSIHKDLPVQHKNKDH